MGDKGRMATAATETVGLRPYTPPWRMPRRSVESDVVDRTGCSVGKRWLWHNARRVGRVTGTGTHPCQALDSPWA